MGYNPAVLRPGVAERWMEILAHPGANLGFLAFVGGVAIFFGVLIWLLSRHQSFSKPKQPPKQ